MDHETDRAARLSDGAMAALRAPLDTLVAVLATEPSALRDVAAFITGYADAMEQRATEIDAERRRTIAEHRAVMEKGTRDE